MLGKESLAKPANAAVREGLAVKTLVDKLTMRIAAEEADTSRSAGFIAERCEQIRAEYLPKIEAHMAELRRLATMVSPELQDWGDTRLVLSRIPFDSDPATDARLRQRYAMELPQMPLPLLANTQRVALKEGNVALAWACTIHADKTATAEARIAAGFADITAVQLPERDEAIRLIETCDIELAKAELFHASATGKRIDPVLRLQIGHRIKRAASERRAA